jgi:hypothetical protein
MTSKAIQVELTDRLVGELPRFFGGRLAAFRELFQNAYRAGAKNVRLTLEGQMLTVEDDGTGCPDPQLLLAAGQTGWDEHRVVEPAGLGFFSLLGRDVSASVTVESFGWRVMLVPAQVLARKPVLVTPGTVTTGLRLVMLLVEPNPERDLKEARAYYPFRVTLNGEEVPPLALAGQHVVETPVGPVHLDREARHQEMHSAIWEHRPIRGGQAFGKALEKAARGAIQQGILHSFRLEWVADMNCGVTPKLPDRNDLQQAPELVAAAGTLLAAIESHFLARAREVVATWPETIQSGDVFPQEGQPKMPEWLTQTQMGYAILDALGWAHVHASDWREPNLYEDGDGRWRHENYAISVFTRRFVRVQDDHVAASINNAAALGADLPWAVHAKTYDALPLKVVGRRGRKAGAWVTLAREIQVGAHRLPFLLSREYADEVNVVLACGPDEAVKAISGGKATLGGFEANFSDLLTGFIACNDHESLTLSWVVADTREPYVDWRKVTHDLVQQVTDDFLPPALAKARSAHHDLVCARDELHDLEQRAKRVAQLPAFRGDAGTKNVLVGINRSLRRLDEQVKKAAVRARLP